ncbi:MAG: ABC transporter permease subunit [Treponema sp.]|jgi:putative aldouronate transport system permease protein|nr:ABC transporter permease subunit [Treponema sp.]
MIRGKETFRHKIWRSRYIYLMVIPVLIYLALIKYMPLWFIRISFYDYRLLRGFSGSNWVGLEHYRRLFSNPDWLHYIRNTLWLNMWAMLLLAPAPLVFALLLNELRWKTFKKTVQTISYLPHFISTVVLVSLINSFVSPSTGILAALAKAMGKIPVNYLSIPQYFVPINVISGFWQSVGWDAVIYIAALSSIDATLYEAARIDGAGRWRQTLHVTLPGLMPTFVILLIMRVGSMLGVNFEKVFLLQNNLNLSASEMLPTFVYKSGMVNNNYSFATAAGLVNSLLSVILVYIANRISKRISGTSLF